MSALSQPTTSLDTRRPFTRADAVAAGIDPRLLRGSRFRRIFRGVYVDRATPEDAFVRAAARSHCTHPVPSPVTSPRPVSTAFPCRTSPTST